MTTHHPLLPHLFRQEYTRMTAVLYRHFGLRHMETAEDIASETFLKAAEQWGEKGIPGNPVAWLYTVARNKTKDLLKRQGIFDTKIKPALATGEQQPAADIEFTPQAVADSELAMIFAVCSAPNPPEAQICLALQVLCGFSVEEIAGAFLSKPETVKKRLQRARTRLRNEGFLAQAPAAAMLFQHLSTVLRTLYLLFNEGYFSRSGNHQVRKDLCSEAMRLALVLVENPVTATPASNALLALMCYQSSRLDAREDAAGDAVLFEQQDESKWHQPLIDRGNYYFVNACTGREASKYHLEAGIAYWHTTPDGDGKWPHILQLYNELLLLEYSPLTALNRTFAFAKVHGHAAGIAAAEQLGLNDHAYYQALMGYLHAPNDPQQAIAHYRQAIRLTRSAPEKKTLAKEIARLESTGCK